ncbi:MAG: hypothetical protein ACRC33_13510 [Gemmataceae bacterium]
MSRHPELNCRCAGCASGPRGDRSARAEGDAMTSHIPQQFPARDLLAFRRGLLDPATQEAFARRLESDPALKAHFDSIQTLELDQTAAAYDASELKRFSRDQASPFCFHVARTAGAVLDPLLATEPAPAEGFGPDQWLKHVSECVYCRRMFRTVHASAVCRRLGMSEPLLREQLLGAIVQPALDRVTRLLAGAASIEEESSPPRAEIPPPVRTHPAWTPEQTEQLARRARSEALGPLLDELLAAVDLSVRAHTWRLVQRDVIAAERRERLAEACLLNARRRFREWDPAEGSFAKWLLVQCRHVTDQAVEAEPLARI